MANILSFCYLRRSVVVRAALEDIKMFVAGRLNIDVQHCDSRRRNFACFCFYRDLLLLLAKFGIVIQFR